MSYLVIMLLKLCVQSLLKDEYLKICFPQELLMVFIILSSIKIH